MERRAAIQAPVIIMGQNRQEARDRPHAMRDHQVNSRRNWRFVTSTRRSIISYRTNGKDW